MLLRDCRFVLFMGDANDTGIHMAHEKNLTLEQTKLMIPMLAKVAAKFENCRESQSR